MTLENDTKIPVGRPRKYANQAERQRAYRQRLKDRGFKVVQRIVPDQGRKDEPLTSSVLDLSEVGRWRFRER
ncbi:hypothetical protein [Oligella urethralis]|uniref:Uncharacterized protein n=1 Tax=Oligella urethralis TaxID=90245 RepID=A0A2X1VJ84_9BURK|nr:hypothetical protein [Oligella urethralis]SPY08420.1 Uncharacterised protein [Oligella urethralis]